MLVPNQADRRESPEIGRIPHYTWAAAHVKFATIYNSPLMKTVRDSIEKSGPHAMAVLSKRFAIHPFSIDRINLVHLDPPRPTSNEPFFKYLGIMIATKVDIDPKLLAQNLSIRSEGAESFDFPYWTSGGEACAIPEPKLFIIGEKNIVKDLVKAKNGFSPENFKELTKDDISIIVNQKTTQVDISKFIPEKYSAIAKVKGLKIHVNVSINPSMSAEVSFNNQSDTERAEIAFRDLAKTLLAETPKLRKEMIRKLEGSDKNRPSSFEELPEALTGLLGLSGLKQFEEEMLKPAVRNSNALMVAKMDLQIGPQPLALVGPLIALMDLSMSKAREEAKAKTEKYISANNLKIIGLAVHNFYSNYNRFPSDIVDKKTGKPLLSWRVAILPYLEHEALYKQFKLDEPWDSPNNIQLVKKLPKVYSALGKIEIDEKGNALTQYLGIRGPGCLFEPNDQIRIGAITDGTSNTIMIVEAKKGAVWSKPEDFDFNDTKLININVLGGVFPGGVHTVFCDGSVRFLSDKTSPDLLKALFTRAGSEIIDQIKFP